MRIGCELRHRGVLAVVSEHSSTNALFDLEDNVDLVGYTNRLDVSANETIEFMVSSSAGPFDVDIVRLLHGDTNPAGPGFKTREVLPDFRENLRGTPYGLPKGSFAVAPFHEAVNLSHGVTVVAWIYPTKFGPADQGLISIGPGTGFSLSITADGHLSFALGTAQIYLDQELVEHQWFFVGATCDAGGNVTLWQVPKVAHPFAASSNRHVEGISAPSTLHGHYVLMGALSIAATVEPENASCHFNGKLAAPRIYERAITADDLALMMPGPEPRYLRESCIAAWDFSHRPGMTRLKDTSGQGRDAIAVNCPMKAVTSWGYRGGGRSFNELPGEYDAITFHADDLEDARWPVAFEFTVPASLPSGVYGARLRATSGAAEDYVPFFVTPSERADRPPIAVLMPTFSYLAYANEHYSLQNPASPVGHDVRDYMTAEDRYAIEHELLSLYDFHRDGSGNAYASILRPLTNVRPNYRIPLLRAPHQFPADLHLIDWLTEKEYSFDVLTDHILDSQGIELLKPYRVILTGSHPEYWTEAMWHAMEEYLAHGGRAMYLGGNGMYWVVSRDKHRPHLIELRRGHNGTGPWRSCPGEEFAESTGERGGLWRLRGLTPQALFGVGMTAAGYDRALPYTREPASDDPRAAFIFEGVPRDAVIGSAGLVLEGAGGFEVDRADVALGTPRHALVLASARGFSDSYQAVVEEVTQSDSQQGGTANPLVRADMLYYEGPKGGAVFAVGSITWSASLSHNSYDNHVSRITENVLTAFANKAWQPCTPGQD
jgi:N,N-dimethylformamidase